MLWIVGVVALGIVAFELTWFWATYSTTKAVHARLDPLAGEIEKQIPAGTPRIEVEKRLGSLGIDTAGAYLPAGGARDPNYPGAYGAIETYTAPIGSRIYSCRARLTFTFDASDNLIRFSHRPQCEAWF